MPTYKNGQAARVNDTVLYREPAGEGVNSGDGDKEGDGLILQGIVTHVHDSRGEVNLAFIRPAHYTTNNPGENRIFENGAQAVGGVSDTHVKIDTKNVPAAHCTRLGTEPDPAS